MKGSYPIFLQPEGRSKEMQARNVSEKLHTRQATLTLAYNWSVRVPMAEQIPIAIACSP